MQEKWTQIIANQSAYLTQSTKFRRKLKETATFFIISGSHNKMCRTHNSWVQPLEFLKYYIKIFDKIWHPGPIRNLHESDVPLSVITFNHIYL
jgi:hypothetical protein